VLTGDESPGPCLPLAAPKGAVGRGDGCPEAARARTVVQAEPALFSAVLDRAYSPIKLSDFISRYYEPVLFLFFSVSFASLWCNPVAQFWLLRLADTGLRL